MSTLASKVPVVGNFLGNLLDPNKHAVQGIMGGNRLDPTAPTPPIVPPVTPAPSPDDAQVMAAKRKSTAAQSARLGRMSTILTPQTGDKLGA